MMIRNLPGSLWIIPCIIAQLSFAQSPAIEIILNDNEPVPGLEGVNWKIPTSSTGIDPFFFSAAIGGNGHVAGEIELSGTGVTNDNDTAVYYIEPGGTPQLLLREGDSATHIVGGGVYGQFDDIYVSDAGEVFVKGHAEIPHEFGTYGFIMSGFPPNLDVLVKAGSAYGSDRVFIFITGYSVNAWGDMVVVGNTDPKEGVEGDRYKHIWRGLPKPENELVRTLKNYPFLPENRWFEDNSFDSSFIDVSLNDEGSISFKGDLRNKAGIWIANASNVVTTLAMDDEPAPGGGIFDSLAGNFRNLSLGENEVVAFVGTLQDESFNSDKRALFLRNSGGIEKLYQKGDPAPGVPGETIDYPTVRMFGPLNDYMLQGNTSGGLAYWSVVGNFARPLAIPGEIPIGFPEGSLSRITNGLISQAGHFAFQAKFDNREDPAVWATGPEGELFLAAGKGMEVKFPDAGIRTLRGAWIAPWTRSDNQGRFPVQLAYRSAPEYIALVDPNKLGLPSDGISGTVLVDFDNNGDFSGEDFGYPGATVKLFADDGGGNPEGLALDEASTEVDGSFLFTDLEAGDYVLVLMEPEDYQFVRDIEVPIDNRWIPVTYTVGENKPGNDFLIVQQPLSISGKVWEDSNNSGEFELEDQAGFEFKVSLFADDGQGLATGEVLKEKRTGVDGTYEFRGLSTGNYVVTIEVPSNYDFIKDVMAPEDDNLIPVDYTEGNTVEDRNFLVSKQVDIGLKITLHQVDANGAVNEEEGLNNIDSPLEVRADAGILDTQREVSKGLVADGVTPLIFKISTFGSDFPDTRKLSVFITDVEGGDIAGGLALQLRVLKASVWSDEFEEFTFPTPKAAWCLLPAIKADDVEFDDGSNEISATLKVTDNVSEKTLVSKTFFVRKPIVTLIHGYNTQGNWGDVYREELGKTRPVTEDTDNFVVTIRYGQKQVENLGKIVEGLADQSRANTAYPLFYLGQLLQQELDEALEYHHVDWAFNRHDVIAHSQGGLLTRILCSEDPTSLLKTPPPAQVRPFQSIENLYRGRFHRVVTIGSPHNGSRLVRYLTALLETNPGHSTIDQLPNLIAKLGVLSGTVRDKFDPLSTQIWTLNNPEPDSRWKPDPDAKFHLVRARINQGMPPSPASSTFGNRTLGLASEGGSIVLPSGSDAVVDFESMGGQTPGQPAADNVFNLPSSSEISHSGPVELFSRDPRNPDAVGQTNSAVAAKHIREALDQDPSQPAGDLVFGPFPLPRLYTEEELQPIADFAFNRSSLVLATISSLLTGNSEATQGLPAKAADMEGRISSRDSLSVSFAFEPATDYPVSGEVFWYAEHVGVPGTTLLPDAVQVNAEDPTQATLVVDSAEPGDYYVHASYYTADGDQVFAPAFLAASVAVSAAELIGIELTVNDDVPVLGDLILPILTARYSDGSVLQKASYGLTFDSSDPSVLDVSNPRLFRALALGTSQVTIEKDGFSASVTVRVEDPAQRGDVSYDEWLAAYYSEEERSDLLLSGPAASQDGDPVPNALEYLFALDPRSSDPQNGLLSRLVEFDGQNYPAVQLEMRGSLGGFGLVLQRSSDLEAWVDFFSLGDAWESGFESPLILDGDYGPETNRFTIRTDVPFTASGELEFFRLQVVVPDE